MTAQGPSRWSQIIILNKFHEQVDSYPLDTKARLLVKLQRQKRRNLGKMTGKKGVPKNKKRAIKKFEELFPITSNFSNSEKQSQIEEDESEITQDAQCIQDLQEKESGLLQSLQSSDQEKLFDDVNKFSIDNSSSEDNIDPILINFHDLSSIEWLLNGPPPVSAV